MNEPYILLKNFVGQTISIEDAEWIDILDAVSQKAVFFDEISPKKHGTVYVKSGDTIEDVNFQNIINRVKINPQSIILLTGFIGTGKSTTLRFLADEIISSKKCNCESSNNCPLVKPLVIYHSFQKEQLHEADISIHEAKEKFIDSLNSVLLAAIENKNNFKDAELLEIKDFWDYSIKLTDENNYLNPAFNWIISKLGKQRDDLNKRKSILIELKNGRGENLLIYLLSFLGFISKELLKEHCDCIIVLLDDLDHSSIATQDAVIETISRFNRDNSTDPQLLIAIRPESSAGKNFGTIFLDKVVHVSPDPSKVLFNRIQYAVNNYDTVLNLFEKTKVKSEDSQLFRDYLQKLMHQLETNPSLQKYVKSISNGSARLAVYSGDGLLKVTRNIMKNEIGLYNLIKSSITRGKGYYKPLPKQQHPIKNIYSLKSVDSPKHLFLKLRILKLLKKERKLGLLKSILNRFEYSLEMQVTALNELLEKPWTLIFSTGCEEYKNIVDYSESSNDDLSRTELGVGYGKELWKKMYYCEEMMFDCWVFRERFDAIINKESNKINDNSVLDRFNIYFHFLQCMLDQEKEDVLLYLKKCNSTKEYTMYFGDELYSFRIIKEVVVQISKIFKSEEINDDIEGIKRVEKWERMIKAYSELENWALHQNNIILNSQN